MEISKPQALTLTDLLNYTHGRDPHKVTEEQPGPHQRGQAGKRNWENGQCQMGEGHIQSSGRLDHRQDRGSSSKLTALFTHGCRARERAGSGATSTIYSIQWAN